VDDAECGDLYAGRVVADLAVWFPPIPQKRGKDGAPWVYGGAS